MKFFYDLTNFQFLLANVVFDKKTGLSQKYGFVEVTKQTLDNLEKQDKHNLEGHYIFFNSAQ